MFLWNHIHWWINRLPQHRLRHRKYSWSFFRWLPTIGWRWFITAMSCLLYSKSFLLQVPTTIAAIISDTLALHLPKTEASYLMAKFKRVHWAGAISLILTVFLLLFPLDRSGTTVSPFTHSRLSQSISFGSLSLRWNSFAPQRTILNGALIASYLVKFFGMAWAFTLIFYLPLYLQAVLEQSALQGGCWLLMVL